MPDRTVGATTLANVIPYRLVTVPDEPGDPTECREVRGDA
jgi:hypothetical protein